MGFSLEEALGSLRLTAGYSTTEGEVERMFHVLQRLPVHA
jgi:cysteine sulfinate desulfinase/cysteine desulfurase-like protein